VSTVSGFLNRDLDLPSAECKGRPALLYGVLEGMLDGILVVTPLGQIQYANQSGQEICQQFTTQSKLPPQIWKICTAMLERQPLPTLTLEDEIHTEQHNLRVRVRLIEDARNEVSLLVTIENRDRNNQILALAEAQRYGLTSRETEVWMLRRANLSYKAIAAKLYITIDTVKKHLKNIRAKQQAAMWHE